MTDRVDAGSSGARERASKLLTFFVGLLGISLALRWSGFAFNLTDSMPVGFYHVTALEGGVRAGSIVRTCVPGPVAAFGASRGYIPATNSGGCPGNIAPLLKIVAAVQGDDVKVGSNGIVVNGHPLPGSRTFAKDLKGRPLSHVPFGDYRLGAGQVWLWTPNPHSWDSRYYGPIDASLVLGGATLVLALGDWPFTGTGRSL